MNSGESPDKAAPERIDDLSDESYAIAAETRNIVRTQIPEILPLLIELGKIGWIDGWRSVRAWKFVHKEE